MMRLTRLAVEWEMNCVTQRPTRENLGEDHSTTDFNEVHVALTNFLGDGAYLPFSDTMDLL